MHAALAVPMRSAALLLVLLGTTSLFAQPSILTIGGEIWWGVDVQGRAVGFKLTHPHHHVKIAARLGNGGGHAYVVAYLMQSIGPDTSLRDQVAERAFELPYPFTGWFDVFNGLELEPGEYWLVIARSPEHAHSSVNWIASNPMALRTSCDTEYLGTKSYTFLSDEADYLPASRFETKLEPYGFGIEITSGDSHLP